MVTIPSSSNSSLRSLERTSLVSRPRRSRRSSVSANRAPRGTAIRRSLIGILGSSGFSEPSHLPRERDVQSFHAEREADCWQRAAEAREQLVVSPAGADRYSIGGVVDLKDSPRVVTQAPHQPQVEDDPLRHFRRQQL